LTPIFNTKNKKNKVSGLYYLNEEKDLKKEKRYESRLKHTLKDYYIEQNLIPASENAAIRKLPMRLLHKHPTEH
jgi:hypothetical protein